MQSVPDQISSTLAGIGEAYHDFFDVFDEVKATTLPPHWSFDCRIDLVPGASLPFSRIYALKIGIASGRERV